MGFDKKFTRYVLESVDEVTIMSDWEAMIQIYDLKDYLWLQNLYAEKEKWPLAYGRQYFCAGMISTQRAESMHATLKKILYSCLTMFRFIEQYELFIDGLRQNELVQDVKCFNTRPITLGMKILMRPADLYKLTIFEWIKKEVYTGHELQHKRMHANREYAQIPYCMGGRRASRKSKKHMSRTMLTMKQLNVRVKCMNLKVFYVVMY